MMPNYLSDFSTGGCLMVEMQPSDAQLLRDYADHGVETAFAEIVTRHTDLVYSAALRQVYSADLARDVTQSVFTDLARKSRSISNNLTPEASLVGWLYRGTRFAARDLYRNEARRTQRERQAMEQLHPTPDIPPDWEQLEPVLDDAMAELEEIDRDALLLRYFKNHDLRTVGVALGVSDDAAQKRVSRAVERLRELFAKRGISAGASGLTVAISANAASAAPAGLAFTISSAVTTGATIATATTVTKTIAMTALQKTLIGATLAVAVVTAVYEAGQASGLRKHVQSLEQRRIPSLTSSNEAALAAVAGLEQKADSLTAQNSELADALAREKADKARLQTENESARRSALMYQDLANRQLAENSSTNAYPTERHAMAGIGRMARRFAELKQQAQREMSSEEKSAHDAMQMSLMGEAFKLLGALNKFERSKEAEVDSGEKNPGDMFACVLYGALNLDEQQFGQVYGLAEKYGKQKDILAEPPASGPDKEFEQLTQQAVSEIKGALNAEQSQMLDQIMPFFPVSRNKMTFNFGFGGSDKKSESTRGQ